MSYRIIDGKEWFLKFPNWHWNDGEPYKNEKAIYERLGQHPRILPYHGVDQETLGLKFEIVFDGDVLVYLDEHPATPIETRLRWVIETAEGIAHLHANEVVWVDCQPSNLLLTHDLHIMLSDFAGSCFNRREACSWPLYAYIEPTPRGLNLSGTRGESQDRFAFVTLAFVLLTLRFPHSPPNATYNDVEIEDHERIYHRHAAGDFDRVPDFLGPSMASVIYKCWRGEYQSTEVLVDEVKKAGEALLEQLKTASVSFPIQGLDG